MLIVAALLLLALGASAHGVRTAGPGARWPFRVAAVLSGGATLVLVLAAGTALAAGRDTWNRWVSGSPSSEGLTLWVVLAVGPVLLLTCAALLALAPSSTGGSGAASSGVRRSRERGRGREDRDHRHRTPSAPDARGNSPTPV